MCVGLAVRKMKETGGVSHIPDFVRQANDGAFDGFIDGVKDNETIRKIMGRVIAERTLDVSTYRDISIRLFEYDDIKKQYETFYEELAETVTKNFASVWSKYGLVITNFFASHMFGCEFPFRTLTSADNKETHNLDLNVLTLAIQFSVLRTLLSVANSKDALNDETCVQIMVAMSKHFHHSSAMTQGVYDGYKENGIADLGHMAFMLK